MEKSNMDERPLRALIISYSFSPNASVGAKRMSALSHSFKDCGITADVLTVTDSSFSIRDDTISHAAANLYKTRVVLPPLHCEGKSIWSRANNTLKRAIRDKFFKLDARQGWNRHLIRAGRNVLQNNDYDFILVSGPPFSSFVAAYKLSLSFDIPLFLDYRDAWTAYKWGKIISEEARSLEHNIVHHAKGIVLCTETLLRFFNAFFPNIPSNRIHVTTNGFFPYDILSLSLDKRIIRIGHAGNFYGERSLSLLIEPLKKVMADFGSSIELHHWGGTIPPCQINDFFRAGLSDALIIHTRQSHECLIDSLASMDLLLAFSGSDVAYAIPYKVFDYLSTGVPILAITPPDSELSRFMQGTDFGFAADSSSPYCITQGFFKCLSIGKYHPPQTYTWERIGKDYTTFIHYILRNT